ncbi:MAG: carboxymuconolactone decarboxylase family protein [Novosphingobium sp.]|nr:carboxymuconolactone decarboxylase family protein [Novosphingobium sp.]
MASDAKNDSLSERRELAFKQISEMISPEQAESIRSKIAADDFGSALLEMTMDHCYADVWPREGLSRRDRSLVTLGILIAQKAAPEITFQTKMALRNGLAPRELEEIVLHALTYVGFSAANLANATIIDVLRELGIKTEGRTAADP